MPWQGDAHENLCKGNIVTRAVMHFGVMTMTSWKHQVNDKKDNKGKMLGLTCRGLGNSVENNCTLLPFSMGHHSLKQHCKSREGSDNDSQKSRK